MVARNFSLQDYPYSRLLQVPDDEREFLTLEELKPHQLTELGVSSTTSNQQHATTTNHIGTSIINNSQQQHHHQTSQQSNIKQQHNIISGTTDQQQQQNAINVSSNNNTNNNSNNNSGNSNSNQNAHGNQHNIYFDLNTQQTTNDTCVVPSVYSDISQGSIMEPSSHQQVVDQQQTLHQSTQQKQLELHHQHNHISSSGKRKNSFTEGSDLDDDLGDDAKSIRTTDENKKQNHSEIEKRRRDKMNTYITELSSMVPMCHAMSRKLDKLTVLRMAVQHLKTIRGAVHSYTEGHYKPAFLSDQELKMLILQAADGFLFVVGCDRGRILYVSASVSQILNYSQGELLGQSWFDILHPKDVAKVKEQLSSSDLSPRERLIDAKTMLPVKTDMPQGVSRLCPGARRSFFCRMKCKLTTQVKEEADTTTGSVGSCHRRKKQFSSDKKYSVIQCTGYLKSWAPAKVGLEEQQENDGDGESCNLSCLVAVGRIPPNIFSNNLATTVNNPTLRSIQFISRHAMDGKFIFIDQRATLVLGFLPQELLGTSMYEYYHHEDIPALAESHKAALQTSEKVVTPFYRFRTKDNGFIQLQSEWKSFKNPWTKDVENLVAKNSVILNDFRTMNSNCYRADGSTNLTGNFDFFTNSNGREMQRMINTHVEASKIGRQIAEQVLDYQRRIGDTSPESSPDPESADHHHHTNQLTNDLSTVSIFQNPAQRSNGTLPGYNQVRNNAMINPNEQAPEPEVINMISGPSTLNQSTNPTTTNDGNDEAAMAVIMSLLEADAGLGGPVDFTGLPWPLP